MGDTCDADLETPPKSRLPSGLRRLAYIIIGYWHERLVWFPSYLARSIIADVKNKGEPCKDGSTSKIDSIVAKLRTSVASPNKYALPLQEACLK